MGFIRVNSSFVPPGLNLDGVIVSFANHGCAPDIVSKNWFEFEKNRNFSELVKNVGEDRARSLSKVIAEALERAESLAPETWAVRLNFPNSFKLAGRVSLNHMLLHCKSKIDQSAIVLVENSLNCVGIKFVTDVSDIAARVEIF